MMPISLDKRLLRYAPQGVTQDQLQEARWWLSDCAWANVDTEDIAAAPIILVVHNVNKYYAGGWASFVTDLEASAYYTPRVFLPASV
jgi:hypothetical protein